MMYDLRPKIGLCVLPGVGTSLRDDLANRFTTDLGLLAVGRPLPDIGMALYLTAAEGHRSGIIQDGANSVPFWVVNLQGVLAVVRMFVAVVSVAADDVMQATGHAEGSMECHMMQKGVREVTSDSEANAELTDKLKQDLADMQKELELARAAVELTNKLRRELAKKQHELDMAQAIIDVMSSELETTAQQTEKFERDLYEMQKELCFARDVAELTERLKRDLADKQHDLELANSNTNAMTRRVDMLEQELQAAKDLVVAQGQELDSVKVEKEMLELELQTSEALLDEERDQAKRIVNKLKRLGCPLDADGYMSSKYAKEALKGLHGVHGKCCITVNYENTLSNPVGAIVYARDEHEACTNIISACAAPKRGLTAANLEAVTSHARQRGDNRLVLDSVAHGVHFWQHMGFTEHPELSGDLVAMSKPLGQISWKSHSGHFPSDS